MRHIMRPALALLFPIAIGGCLHAPMPWSPDGKWIAYVVEVRPTDRLLRPGWLFESPTSTRAVSKDPGRPTSYRLWATRGDSGASVLLEESPHPLTAPGWSPDGRALAFGRVASDESGTARFEVVILEGPTRRRIVASRPLPAIDAEATRLPGQAIAWSPDGRYLAIPQFVSPGLAIIRADNGRPISTIPDAFLPSWSPDGSRLAFYLRGTGHTLNVIDSPLGQSRLLAEVGQAGQAPAWTRDGLSILTVARKLVPRGAEPPLDQAELIRVRVDTGLTEKIQTLTTNALQGRDRSLEGVSISFVGDGEDLFCSTVFEGMPNEIVWYRPRNNETLSRFQIVDHSIPVGSLSVSPDGRTLAARVGPIDRLGAPALCDLESLNFRGIRLISPDDSSRVEWVATLVDSAKTLLSALPTASTDPKVPSTSRLDRPSLLPILGEFETNTDVTFRLRKIGKMGRALCDRPADSPPANAEVAARLEEARLFFDYLSEDYAAALASLDALEESAESPDRRVRLLSLRAQIFIAQGKVDRAGNTISYLRELERKPARRVEWTGAGYVLAGVEPASGQGWPDYLAWRASAVRAMLQGKEPADHVNPDAPRFNFGPDPNSPRPKGGAFDHPFRDEANPGDRLGPMNRPRINREHPEGLPRL